MVMGLFMYYRSKTIAVDFLSELVVYDYILGPCILFIKQYVHFYGI